MQSIPELIQDLRWKVNWAEDMPAKLAYEPSESPRVSVIIPSRDGFRDGAVPRLMDQIKAQTFGNVEIILVIGERPNGHARNVGVEIARGKHFIFVDDDITLGSSHIIQKIVSVLDSDPTLGGVGTSCLAPTDSTWFQKRVAKEVIGTTPVVDEVTYGGLIMHACLAIPSKVYDEIGGESDTLETGTDTDVRIRIDRAGYRTALVPDSWVYHPQDKTLRQFVMHYWWYGKGTPQMAELYPEHIGKTIESYWGALLYMVHGLVTFLPRIFLESRHAKPGFTPLNALADTVRRISYGYHWMRKRNHRKR